MKIVIETERLILREIEYSDAEDMFKLNSDIEVQKYLGNNPIKKMEEAYDNIVHIRGQYEEFGVGRFAVINKETNQFVGWSGLKFINEETNQHLNYYDVGYRFIKDFWGFGYATETAKAVIEYGFDKLSIKELFAIADFENVKSQHVLEKIGFIKKEIFMYNNRNHYWFEFKK